MKEIKLQPILPNARFCIMYEYNNKIQSSICRINNNGNLQYENSLEYPDVMVEDDNWCNATTNTIKEDIPNAINLKYYVL